MRTLVKSLLALLVLTVCAGSAFGDITISLASPAWQQVGGAATWVLPAVIPGCGSENETTCEPTGVFYASIPIGAATEGWIGITDQPDPTGAPGGYSDYLLWNNNGPNGNGQFLFYSDPNLNVTLPPFQGNDSTCTEDPVAGCVASFAFIMSDGSILYGTWGSDGEAPWDPYGAGYDTSDGISFQAQAGPPVPEPGTLALLGSGLFGLAGAIRRKFAR